MTLYEGLNAFEDRYLSALAIDSKRGIDVLDQDWQTICNEFDCYIVANSEGRETEAESHLQNILDILVDNGITVTEPVASFSSPSLSNVPSSISISCDAGGTPQSGAFDSAYSYIYIRLGTSDDTANWTYTITGTSDVSANNSTIENRIDITAITADSGYAEVTCSKTSYDDFVINIVVYKDKVDLTGAVLTTGAQTASGVKTWSDQADFTNGFLVTGGDITASGNITTSAGEISASGDITSSTGNIAASAGTVTASGDITTSGGDLVASAGAISSSGNITTSAGEISASGDITSSTGNIAASAGTVTASGDITSSAGNVVVTAGTISSSGDITSSSGDIAASTGSITASGNITSSTGSIAASAGSVTASGNITSSAGNISASAGTVTASGDITTSTGNVVVTAGTITSSGDIKTTGGNFDLGVGNQFQTISSVTNYIRTYVGSNSRMEFVCGNGTSSQGGWEFWSGTPSLKVLFRGDGNCGWNTSSPSQKIHVSNGNIYVDVGWYLTNDSNVSETYDGSETRTITPTAVSNNIHILFELDDSSLTCTLNVDLNNFETTASLPIFITANLKSNYNSNNFTLNIRNSSNVNIVQITDSLNAGQEAHWACILNFSGASGNNDWYVLSPPNEA